MRHPSSATSSPSWCNLQDFKDRTTRWRRDTWSQKTVFTRQVGSKGACTIEQEPSARTQHIVSVDLKSTFNLMQHHPISRKTHASRVKVCSARHTSPMPSLKYHPIWPACGAIHGGLSVNIQQAKRKQLFAKEPPSATSLHPEIFTPYLPARSTS